MITRTITIEAGSLEDARQQVKGKVPEGFYLLSVDVLSDGRPTPRSKKTIQIKADTLDEAREKIQAETPDGFTLLSENVISDGKPKTAKSSAETVELAFTKALEAIPSGAEILEKKELAAPQRKTITFEANDEIQAQAKAAVEARNQFSAAVVQGIRLVSTGKSGFLGIGKKANQYEADVMTQPASVEVSYKQQAEVSAEVGEVYTPKPAVAALAVNPETASDQALIELHQAAAAMCATPRSSSDKETHAAKLSGLLPASNIPQDVADLFAEITTFSAGFSVNMATQSANISLDSSQSIDALKKLCGMKSGVVDNLLHLIAATADTSVSRDVNILIEGTGRRTNTETRAVSFEPQRTMAAAELIRRGSPAYDLKHYENPELADLIDRLNHQDDATVRIAAVEALGELRAGYVVELLTGALEDKDAGVRTAAAQALASMGTFADAARRGDIELVTSLLSAGVNPNVAAESGDTALMLAAGEGHAETVQALLEHGADPNLQANNDTTALITSVKKGHTEVVRLLLQGGADPNLKPRYDKATLTLAADNARLDIMQLLLEHGADPNVKHRDNTLLMSASEKGQTEFVKLLLDNGADANIPSEHNATPLVGAAYKGATEIVRLLLDKGANPNLQRSDGAIPLIFAAQGPHVDIVRMLLEAGADPNLAFQNGITPIIAASSSDNGDVVKLLLDKGANANASTADGTTALIGAAQKESLEVVQHLLDAGADPSARRKDGATPLMMAAQEGRTEIVKALLEKGADPNTQNGEGITALMLTVYDGYLEVVKLLLAHGADVNLKDTRSRTAHEWATAKSHREIADLIRPQE